MDQRAGGISADAAEFGVATTGFNGEFNGGSITLGNASPDYGIVGSSTFPGSIGESQIPIHSEFAII